MRDTLDTVTMYERAAGAAAAMVARAQPEQRHAATPCREWDVGALVEHMAGGTVYLETALGDEPGAPATDPGAYRAAVDRCAARLREQGVLERRCLSPAGFEWSIEDAAAGTAMDQLVHTWDLAVAIGADRRLDPELVDACVAMFLPHMPAIGREAGIVGPEVPMPHDASPQDRLLGAMGRHP
jgi:uncharacterized protein (TIGR03086 family)